MNKKDIVKKPSKTQEEIESKFLSFFGAFGDIDSEEMIKSIEESRTIKDIDVSWIE